MVKGQIFRPPLWRPTELEIAQRHRVLALIHAVEVSEAARDAVNWPQLRSQARDLGLERDLARAELLLARAELEAERWATLPSSRPWDRLPRSEEPRRPHRVLFNWRGWTLWKEGATR